MPFDPNDDETKAAIAEAVQKATEKLDAKNRELIAEKRRAGEGKIDAAELERVEAERDKLATDFAAAQRELTKVTKAATDATKALEAEQAHTQRLLISDGLTQALTAAGVKDPMHLKAASALLRDEHKPVVTIDGDKRVAMIGDKPLTDFVKAWAIGDEGKSFVAAPGNSGGGATGGKSGGGEVNPFAKETFNLTEQGRIMKENPDRAASLQAAAGVQT